MSRNEANTRKELIDKALQTAGMSLIARFTTSSARLWIISMRIIGLTATLAAFIERNTFQLFRSDGIPSFNYPYRDAVNQGDWVDYSLPQAQTRFQREGTRGANLSEEDHNTLMEQG
jgi:type I site-specific restriction endonuclease